MNERSLTWLAAFLILVGILPLLSIGIATVIAAASGCINEVRNLSGSTCPYHGTPMGETLASMMLAGVYVVISAPLGLIGAAILIYTRLRARVAAK